MDEKRKGVSQDNREVALWSPADGERRGKEGEP